MKTRTYSRKRRRLVLVLDGLVHVLEGLVELLERDGTRPQDLAAMAAHVDDRRGRAARRRTVVDDHRDVVGEHLLGHVSVDGGRVAREVGRADGQRAGALEQVEG